MPPVYSPEVAADAILHAAERPRRELWVGANVPLIIAGNHLLPRIADRYLARTNVDAQQGEEPIDPGRPDYLYHPLGDRGVHGPFADEANSRSVQLALTKRKGPLLACLTALAIAAPLARLLARR